MNNKRLFILLLMGVFSCSITAKTYTNDKGTFTNGVKHQDWSTNQSQGKSKRSCKNIDTVTVKQKGKKSLVVPFNELFIALHDEKKYLQQSNRERKESVIALNQSIKQMKGKVKGKGNGKGNGAGNGSGGGKGKSKNKTEGKNKKSVTHTLASLFPKAQMIKISNCKNKTRVVTKKEFMGNPSCFKLGTNRRGLLKYAKCKNNNKNNFNTRVKQVTLIEIF